MNGDGHWLFCRLQDGSLYCGVDDAEFPVVIEPPINAAGGDPGMLSGLLFGGVLLS